jgi:glycosyltransferase involved in cell wall biosynthesis
MAKRKVVVVGLKGLPARGGAATVGEGIIHQLREDYDFTVLSISSHTDHESGEIDGVRQIVFPKLGKGGNNTFWYYLRCLWHCLTHHYDLVHLHHAESGFITPFLRLRNKVVVTLHGVFSYRDPKFSAFHNWFFRFSERLNIKFASKVVSVSRENARYVLEKYGRVIHYVPNSIKTIGMLLPLSSEPRPYLLFAAGRIYQIKGLHLLLSAMRVVKPSMPLVVAGKVEEVPEYQRELRALGENQEIKYVGLIPEKSTLLALTGDAELFIFPSLTEAMSIMLLEAVSVKVPVIASDIPANLAIFGEDELLFFRSGDEHDLARKLAYALDNKEEMRSRAEKAYARLTAEYTPAMMGERYREIYRSLI